MMSVNVNDLSLTSLETITAFAINGGAQRFTLDELQNATIANSQANDAITGKGGRTIGQLKRNKSVTISGTNGMISMGLLEVEVGASGEHRTATPVKYMDYMTVTGNTATTKYLATGTIGNEIGELIVKNSNGTIRKRLVQDAEVGADKFAYDPESKKITFDTGTVEDGAEIVAYYIHNVEGDVVSNISDNYSEKVELYIDGFAEDHCHNVYHVQFHVPYADFTGTFDLAMGDSQTTHGFEATSLPSTCRSDGKTLFWELTVYGEDAS